jgi:hypothetical protein
MHNQDNKGFVYTILTQLNSQKWGERKLEEKDDISHYSKDKLLQGYVNEMINNVSQQNLGIPMKQRERYHIVEQGLHIISYLFKNKINYNIFSRFAYTFLYIREGTY